MKARKTDLERFEAKVDRSGGPNACHPWVGGFGQYGCPNFWVNASRTMSARRWLWEHVHGPIEGGLWVTPACGTLACVNIRHLSLRAHNDNVARFWEKVNKTSACWIWTGFTQKGYGVFYRDRKRISAHRFSYELHFGPIPTDDGEWCVCHRCDHPPCVRPEHLFLGRDADNSADCIAKGRHSHGPKHAEIMKIAREARRLEQRITGTGDAE